MAYRRRSKFSYKVRKVLEKEAEKKIKWHDTVFPLVNFSATNDSSEARTLIQVLDVEDIGNIVPIHGEGDDQYHGKDVQLTLIRTSLYFRWNF
jgi:hypothetical protein